MRLDREAGSGCGIGSLASVAKQAVPSGGAAQQEPAFRTVVCGVDGSPEGLEAMHQALELGAEGATYWALSVWDPAVAVHADLVDELRERGMSALRSAQDAFPGVTPLLLMGRDVPALLKEVGDLEADLVCVGSHGTSRAAGVLFGSVASAMAHFASCSVLVARQPPNGPFPALILHANDGSPESLDAARVAGRLAARHGSTVVTLHVGETRDVSVAEQAVEIIESCGREPVMKVEHGSPSRRIVEVANQTRATLIVMGSRGRPEGPRHHLLGAHQAARHPVLGWGPDAGWG